MNYDQLNNEQKEFVDLAYKHFQKDELSRTEINTFAKDNSLKYPAWLRSAEFRLTRGIYKLPVEGIVNPSKNVKQKVSKKPDVVSKQISVSQSVADNLVPSKEQTFVPFGNYKDIKYYSKLCRTKKRTY